MAIHGAAISPSSMWAVGFGDGCHVEKEGPGLGGVWDLVAKEEEGLKTSRDPRELRGRSGISGAGADANLRSFSIFLFLFLFYIIWRAS